MPLQFIFDIETLSVFAALRPEAVYITITAWAELTSNLDRFFDFDAALDYVLNTHKYNVTQPSTYELRNISMMFYVNTWRSIVSNYLPCDPYYATYTLIDSTTLRLELYYMPFTRRVCTRLTGD